MEGVGAPGGMGGWGRRGYGEGGATGGMGAGWGRRGHGGVGGGAGVGKVGTIPIPDPASDILIESNPGFSK